jgi:hypothetical protein
MFEPVAELDEEEYPHTLEQLNDLHRLPTWLNS